MNLTFENEFILPGRPEAVWKLLDNPTVIPDVIKKEFPETDSITEIEPDRYLVVVKLRLGIFGITFNCVVGVEDRVRPDSMRTVVKGKGGGGTISGAGNIFLSAHEGGCTNLAVSAAGEFGGIFAIPGEAVTMSFAKKVLNRFFDALSEELKIMMRAESKF